MIVKTPHTHNGKLRGVWIQDVKKGRSMYLAFRKKAEIYDNSWMIEKEVVRRCVEGKVDNIAVAVKQRGDFIFYASRFSNFIGSPHLKERIKEMRYYMLPLNCFEITPFNNEDWIEKLSRLRK